MSTGLNRSQNGKKTWRIQNTPSSLVLCTLKFSQEKGQAWRNPIKRPLPPFWGHKSWCVCKIILHRLLHVVRWPHCYITAASSTTIRRAEQTKSNTVNEKERSKLLCQPLTHSKRFVVTVEWMLYANNLPLITGCQDPFCISIRKYSNLMVRLQVHNNTVFISCSRSRVKKARHYFYFHI